MRPALRSLVLCLAAVLMLVAVSCRTASLSRENREKIRFVSVNEVVVPDQADLTDKSGLAMGSLLWMGMAEVEGRRRSKQVADTMDAAGIDLAVMVREEFLRQLTEAGTFEIDPEQSQGTFQLEVRSMSMHRPMGFTSKLKPSIAIQAELSDASGSVVWKKFELTSNLSDKTPAYEYDDYIREPERLQKAFATAISLTVADLIAHLDKD